MNTIFALGFFDGVHLGHQALLTACKHLAERKGCTAGAVTFASHPDAVVTGTTPQLINTVEERQRLLMGFGIRDILVLPFDENLRSMQWRDFLEDLIQKGAAGFVCGEDFRFGFRISSSHIRSLLEEGQMEQAVRFLGHPHILTGAVVSGRKLGRTLGIPTANLLIPEGVVQLRHGVYACKAIAEGKEYLAVTNIGSRPTVGGHRVTVEPWLMDFDGDLYGKEITLCFHAFLRPERKFDSLEELKVEIQKNAAQTRKIFEKT